MKPREIAAAAAAVSPEDRLRRINAFVLALLEAQDLADLLWSIADWVGEIMGFDDCVVYLREGDVLVQRAAYGIKSQREREIFKRIEIPLGSGIVGTVAKTGVAEIIDDTEVDPRYIADQFPGRSELTVPVVYEGKVIGVLDTEAATKGAYVEGDRSLLQAVANIAAARIASAIADETLRKTQAALRSANEELERRVAERTAELERKGEQLRVILRSIGDGIIAVDDQGLIAFMSSAAEFLTGWEATRAVGRPLDQVYRVFGSQTGTTPFFWDDRLQLQGPESIEPREWALESRNSERRLISEGLRAIRGSRDVGWVLVFRDITQQRRVEEELRRTQQLESLGLLAGGIAHDFNNYLQVIHGNLEFLTLSPELKDFEHLLGAVDAALKASRQAAGLPRQLMTLSKGGAPMKTRAVELASLVKSAAEFCLAGSNVRAEVELSPDLGRVDVDQGQITQVLNNLLINAVQAMPDGGRVRIEAARRPGRGGGVWAVIAIEDEGPGMSKEMLGRIFDPFFTTRNTGSGLGLTTAHSVVQRHGGFMNVSSEVGRGSRFEVWLQASGEGAVRPETHVRSSVSTGALRVLILDDEGEVQDVLAKVLSVQGHRTTCVKSAARAVSECELALTCGEPFDVALLDVTLPGGGGGSRTLMRLRDIQPDLPAVVMSGYSGERDIAAYESRGFQGVLIKPFVLGGVIEVLEKAIARYPG